MSKYKLRGAYHYDEFSKKTIYRSHVESLILEIMEVIGTGPKVAFEIGAGEGLILSQLKAKGLFAVGCDVDTHAVALAADKDNDVELVTQDCKYSEHGPVDIVLMCDVLEHVDDPRRVVNEAKKMGDFIVIAIPDRKDRHAQHEVNPNDIERLMDGWTLRYKAQRHARHVMIYEAIR